MRRSRTLLARKIIVADLLLSRRSVNPLRCIDRFEQGVQQHVAAGCQVCGFGVLDLVVADAADAGTKTIAVGATRAM